ncbi:glutathione S-transferase family protein [Alsobacter soli]|uniref:Glutathione S-transferase family protein n=1 Tax=Alsobacter soli TaxID=2109933 RepID=A0A2T1HZK5_9HYPH|nr:glutathione S-transferase [Alsobacter soli]PSC07065.1 glutathione S-transferase family protein [Alsobacter soli]
MRIYGDLQSGNCLKVKYTADALGLPYEWLPVDILRGESRTAEFLAMSPMGQVPVVVFDDGRALAQSNAIVRYLARGTDLLPEAPFEQAQVDEWLFWEQNAHEFFVAGCRFQMLYLRKAAAEREPWRVARADQALDFMDAILSGRDWFAAGRLTVADISLLAYTRLAGEGGLDLTPRTSLRAWIRRCEQALGLSPVETAQ